MRRARGLFGSWIFLSFLLLWGLSSEARYVNDWTRAYVEKLRHSSVADYDIGALCEQVARLEMSAQLDPRHYEVRTNISYGDWSHVMGELDVVVFDRRTGRAVVVAEVKCWEDLPRARQKGQKQQRRFREVIQGQSDIDIWDRYEKYSMDQFQGECQHLLIGQAGSRAHGFDRELQLDLEDLKDLRRAMLACSKNGRCRTWKR